MARWAWVGTVLLGMVAAGCRGGAGVQQPGAGANPSTGAGAGPTLSPTVAQPGAAATGTQAAGAQAVGATSEAPAQGGTPVVTGSGQTSGQQARAERLKARIPQPKEGTMQKEAPEPLLMEMWAVRPTVAPVGRRILATGKWWRYTDSDYVDEADPATGELRMKRVRIDEGWWDSECSLTSEEVAKLQAVIRASGVMDLPAETPPSKTGVIGGTDVFYTFEIDGRRHRIHYLEGGDNMPAPIKVVDELMEDVVFNSLQRWRQEKGLDPVAPESM